MAAKSWCFLVTGLWLLSACGDDPEGNVAMGPGPQGGVVNQPGNALPDGGTSMLPVMPAATGDSSLPTAVANNDAGGNAAVETHVPANDAGAQTTQPDAAAAAPDAAANTPPQPYDYMMQAVSLSADLVIPKGKTVRVGPGVKFTAKGANLKVVVQGSLVVEGSVAAPSSFMGSGEPETWQGIVVESGGSLTLNRANVGNAKYGVFAQPGSSFAIDHCVFDTSFKGAVLQANGTVDHSVFKAELLFPALTESVSIDDPNGYLTIIDASPTVTNSRFEGSGGLNDMVRIGGNASPKFDHCYVNNSHCGFHTAGGTNTSARISNTVFESLSYGIMAYTTKPIVENSVFRKNSSDIGMCSGATAANAPSLMGNFYEGGSVLLDASCDKIGTKDGSPAQSANSSAGPSGL